MTEVRRKEAGYPGMSPEKYHEFMSSAEIAQMTVDEVVDEEGGFRPVKRRTVYKAPGGGDGGMPGWSSPEALDYTRNIVTRLDDDDQSL